VPTIRSLPDFNQKSQSENWRCLLDEVRTFFEQNPDDRQDFVIFSDEKLK